MKHSINTTQCVLIDPEDLKLAPIRTNDPNNPDSGNGLITSIWGPHEWESFHAKTFGYPIKPTDQQKQDYLRYFTSLGDVLPCIYCRTSYKQFITESDTVLDLNAMTSRETLTKWGMRLHNRVNNKLGVDYGDTYEELCYKYESYRAKCTNSQKGCTMPLNIKAKSYQKADIHRAPIIDYKYSAILIPYAEQNGLLNYSNFLAYYSKLIRNSKEWTLRDCAARKVIKHMKKNGISSLDKNGMPSYHELVLISMLSSTLEKNKLDEIYNNIRTNNK